MARNVASSVENNFTRGLITEASGLNFPENACTDTDNCHFELTGRIRRRWGIDFEDNYALKEIARSNSAIATYLWRSVAGDGNKSLFVLQVGFRLYFYDVSSTSTVSSGALATLIDLRNHQPVGASNPGNVECQFCDGFGYLFVTHPSVEALFVSYDGLNATATAIDIKIRDFVGVDDGLGLEQRAGGITNAHLYNLMNQGWIKGSYDPRHSSTSIIPTLGALTLTVLAGGPWHAGDTVYCWSTAGISGLTNGVYYYMMGTVTSYSGTSLVLNITAVNPGSGSSATDWWISDKSDYVYMMFQATGYYPSNADVWWMFKDATDFFQPQKTISGISRGGTPAPNGHFIFSVFNQDRNTVSGLGSGVSGETTGYSRMSTCAFFAGRVFYSGLQSPGYSGNIYFSQILHQGGTSEFGKCYQVQDPTAEDLHDLLPNDGGVISIPDAGTILKLWATAGGLIVFAANGVWQITGSTGIGFTANDFTVRKITSIRTISHTSFVDVGGYPAWWGAEGIYILSPDGSGLSVKIQSLTDQTIKTYYDSIPLSSKRQARGFFDIVTKKIQWVFRSTAAGSVDQSYEFDRILIFNTLISAFYPWSVTTTNIRPHAVISISTPTISSTVKYLVSGPFNQTNMFTFAEEKDQTYKDWKTYDAVGVDYDSYAVSGYKIHGNAQKKFQANYVYIFSKEIPSQYYFQTIWNYANTGASGKYGSKQFVNVGNTNYDVKMNRLKARGEGLALQFKLSSVSGQPFDIVGWSTYESSNASP